MNSVERVKAICKSRKIPISRLEKDIGFSNGYISQLRKGIFPGDRLASIAKYLDTTTEFLLNGEETEKTPIPEVERSISDEDLMAAFFDGAEDLTKEEMAEMWEDARDYVQYKLAQKRRKNNG